MLPGILPVCAGSASAGNITRDGIDLDGVTEAITRNFNGSTDNDTKITISMWFRNYSEDGYLIDSSDSQGQKITVSIDSGYLYISIGCLSAYGTVNSYIPFYNESPIFLLVSVDLEERVVRAWCAEFFFGGLVEMPLNGTLSLNSPGIGFAHDGIDTIGGSSDGNMFFYGIIGDVCWVHGQAITDTTVFASDLGGGFAPVPYDGPFGESGYHLTFSDNLNVLADSSGNGNDFQGTPSEGDSNFEEGVPFLPTAYDSLSLIGDMTNGDGLESAFNYDTDDRYTDCASGPSTATTRYVGGLFLDCGGVPVEYAKVYGSNNVGFISGTNPTVTLQLRAKQSPPASATDGTLLGSTSFTDTNNENAGRTILSNDNETAWQYVWIAIITSSATHKYVAEVEIYPNASAGGGGSSTIDETDRVVGWLTPGVEPY